MSSIVEAVLQSYFDSNPYDFRVFGLDVETTGLGNSARLVEVAAVGYEFDGLHLNFLKFSTLINPGIPIPEEVTKIHGITDEMVKDAPSTEEALTKLASFLEGVTSLIAHNADFDKKMILQDSARIGQEFKFGDKFKCSLQLAKRSGLPTSDNKLGTIAKHFGYTNENAHRAADDALCALFVWGKLVQRT